jgi:tRNA(fMet)-specific endonuclease VapC
MRNAGGTIALSSIVVFELRYGVARSQRKQFNAAAVNEFQFGGGNLLLLPFDDEDAAHAGALRAALAARGMPIGPYDVLIAGQALRHRATLVTANTREFARVPGLKVEDWTRAE